MAFLTETYDPEVGDLKTRPKREQFYGSQHLKRGVSMIKSNPNLSLHEFLCRNVHSSFTGRQLIGPGAVTTLPKSFIEKI